MINKYLYLTFLILILISGCTKKDETTTTSSSNISTALDFTQDAANSLPQLKASGRRAVGNISSIAPLFNFFKQECYMPEDDGNSYDGFCPEDVRDELDSAIPNIGEGTDIFDQYKLTATTLIGLIYHAEMYSQGPEFNNTCSNYDAVPLATDHSPLFSGGTVDPDKFIIDYFNTLYCVKESEIDDHTSYSTFGYDETASSLSNLTIRHRVPYNGDVTPGQTDIFQVYLGVDPVTTDEETPTPTFLAFNFAGVNTMYTRSVILSNLEEHKFAVRYSSAGQSGNIHIIAIGVGGVDKSSGAPVEGYYIAKVIEADTSNVATTTTTYCVNNSDGSYDDTDMTLCTGIPWNSIDGDAVATYLELDDNNKSNTLNFLSYFDDTNILSTDHFPTTDDDADENFPRAIE